MTAAVAVTRPAGTSEKGDRFLGTTPQLFARASLARKKPKKAPISAGPITVLGLRIPSEALAHVSRFCPRTTHNNLPATCRAIREAFNDTRLMAYRWPLKEPYKLPLSEQAYRNWHVYEDK